VNKAGVPGPIDTAIGAMPRAYRLLQPAVLGAALAAAGAHARNLERRGGSRRRHRDATRRANRQHRTRIAGIDGPEKAQAFGAAAKESLARFAFGKHAALRCDKRDRYGRELCGVFVGARDAARPVARRRAHAGGRS
jgi:endonuclease YncB( thermonuclease family)